QALAQHLPAEERGDLLTHYNRRLVDPDPAIHMPAARAWSRYEGSCSTLLASAETVTDFERDDMALDLARIEAHYFVNNSFLRPGELLDNIGRIRDIPGFIVQGRYDMVCPPITAALLADAWPIAELEICPESGHSSMEPRIRSALIAVTNRLRDRRMGRKEKIFASGDEVK
ncbi:MAG: prolyl aminopeptidase, partial [Alphaproteobacteria bacterium]